MTDDWWRYGKCVGQNPDLWYPNHETGETARKAVAICMTCPVRTECLDWALETNELFGVWGGQTVRDRRTLRRSRGLTRPTLYGAAKRSYDNAATPIVIITPGDGDPRHGTLTGYVNHRCRGECCRQAKRDYTANRREQWAGEAS